VRLSHCPTLSTHKRSLRLHPRTRGDLSSRFIPHKLVNHSAAYHERERYVDFAASSQPSWPVSDYQYREQAGGICSSGGTVRWRQPRRVGSGGVRGTAPPQQSKPATAATLSRASEQEKGDGPNGKDQRGRGVAQDRGDRECTHRQSEQPGALINEALKRWLGLCAPSFL